MNTALIELLYRALNTESGLGVVVQTNDPDALRQKLYQERKKDADLACLSFTISPTSPETELWIIKK